MSDTASTRATGASASPAPPRPDGELRPPAALARALVAVAAFVLTGLALRAVAIAPGGDVIGAKLDWWRAEAARYDTVFVGSSHVLRAFVPETFDRELAAAGLESRSFNFGVQAVHLIEERWLLERVLAAGDGQLRRVFFEYQWLTPQIDPRTRSCRARSTGTTGRRRRSRSSARCTGSASSAPASATWRTRRSATRSSRSPIGACRAGCARRASTSSTSRPSAS
jgi:hypothetical protein